MNGPDREETVFDALLLIPEGGRAAYLDQACGGDADLRRRVEELLQAHESGGRFMEKPAAPRTGKAVMANLTVSERPGDRIGRYKLMEKIGEGGCGVVYVAEQQEPVRRRVALKIIKLGMDTRQVIARFEAERQALALMDHPNIARVLDAGATETGRPYFVMELVRGIKITDYCDENKASTAARLELFVQVCHAIQHAHQKGVIHRDIKPSNILVTVNDGAPVPKVIDFGIAKATQGRLTDQTVYTAFEQFLGTPAYMSPEQAVMTSLDIDTRSDIYSLGVLLYELLTGKTPFETSRLLEAGLDEMRRTIREEEPLRPSTRLSTMLAGELTTTAQRRHTEAPGLIHVVRGDLDWIVMKALEKDRTRRYATANGLALDVQRHLNDEPVAARPPSRLYRFQKLARRNKLAFAAAAALMFGLATGAVVSTLQAVRASRAEAVATRARQQSGLINRFLTEDLLYQATPDQNARERKVTMEQVLERATRRLDQNAEIKGQPEVEATLRLAVGSTYSKLDVLEEAERQLNRAVELRRRALGPLHRDTLEAQEALAEFYTVTAKRFAEAESLSRDAWVGRQKVLGPEHRDTLASLSCYVVALTEQKKLVEAEPLARQRLQTCEAVFGPLDPETIDAVDNLAVLLANRGDFKQAEHYGQEMLTRYERTGQADKPDALLSASNLAMFRFMQGRNEEAEKLLLDVRPRVVRVCGAEHNITLHVQHVLARALAAGGKLDAAEALCRETLAARRRVSPIHEGTGSTLLILGQVLVQKNRLDEAEPFLREALELFHKYYPSKPELAARAENWLGAIQLARRDFAGAETLLTASSEPLLGATANISVSERLLSLDHLVQLYQAWGKPEKAAIWQQKLAVLAKTTP